MRVASFLKWSATLLIVWPGVLAAQVSPPIPKSPQSISTVQAPTATDLVRDLRQELDTLKATTATQAREIAQQKGALDAIAQRRESSNTNNFTAAAIVLAAAIAAYLAFRNQNKQADQERLLKAVEIVMESRSGHQAAIRMQNLSVFLDAPTKKHFEDIKKAFSGPEFDDLHVALAQAMAAKANTPEEVLLIWKTVLKGKNVFTKVIYPEKDLPKST